MGVLTSSGIIRRIYGTMFLLPVIFAVWIDQKIGGLVLICLALLMGLEAKRMVDIRSTAGYLFSGTFVVQSIPSWLIDRPSTVNLGFAVFVAAIVLIKSEKIIVALFIGLLSLCIGYANFLLLQPSGHIMLVALAAIIASSDSAAYFVGKHFGGPKIWQGVSPNKTISGSVGGLIAAIGATIFLANIFDLANKTEALVAGLSIGILAQAGDFLESAVKRRLNLKDTGSILLGHGGMLDRFDGYVLVVPAFYLYFFGI